jgi:hypothetical protein
MRLAFRPFAVAAALAVPVAALSQTLRFVDLPPIEQRHIIGVWRLPPPIPCTRSIERVAEQFYMVARCKESPNVDGSKGDVLRKVSDNEYENATGTTYRIMGNGTLVAKSGAEVIFEAKKQKELWP